jgi:signal transduction histidine kinase/ActR/RegA family two-component response regulator
MFQADLRAIPFAVAAAISAGLAIFASRRRGLPMAPAFAVMMAGEAIWALFEALELVSADSALKRFWNDFRVAGAVITVLGMLAFVLRYTGCAEWLKFRRFAPICAPAVAMVFVSWTNPWHHLYWIKHEYLVIDGLNLAKPIYGPAFWAHFGYCYILIAIETLLLAHAVIRSAGVYRAQSAVVLFAVILPWVVSAIDMSQAFGWIYVDAAAMTFGVTGLAFLPGLLRYRLLDLTPVAWAAVVKGMNDPVVVIDRLGRIVELNPAARPLAGRPYPEILGALAVNVFSHWSTLAKRLAQIAEDGEASFELVAGDPARPCFFDAQISGLGESGFPSGWVLVLRNMTEHKRAAEERVRMLGEQAARAEAESANRAKDRFLATLSHELRTPLTPVLATVTAMLADADTPEAMGPVLEMIRRNVALEARLIDDLLDLSRISRGALYLKREIVDAHELVDHVIEICRDDFDRTRLRLVLDLAAGGHHIDVDPARFQQVLWNLIKNAIKFTPAGGQVTVRTRDRDQGSSGRDGGGLIIVVSDTGIGIEPAILPRIFDILDQGGRSATRQFGGLGLGLTISRSLVEQHGGRLTAASAGAGTGATFTLEIPTVKAPAAPPSAGSASDVKIQSNEHAVSGATRPRRPLKTLLVDDNADTLKYLSKVLTMRGYIVRTADSLATALALASEVEFDFLISDIELPDGSGLELMWRLKASRPLPAIALSGFGSPEDIEQSRSAGFALHLTKPVDFGRLDQAIQDVAASREAGKLVSR